jgi:hypothetical protein
VAAVGRGVTREVPTRGGVWLCAAGCALVLVVACIELSRIGLTFEVDIPKSKRHLKSTFEVQTTFEV